MCKAQDNNKQSNRYAIEYTKETRKQRKQELLLN